MRTTSTCTYNLPDLITSPWVINDWLINANTLVLSPLMNTSVGALQPIIALAELENDAAIEAADNFFSAAVAMVVIDPYEAATLMRFNATVFLNG